MPNPKTATQEGLDTPNEAMSYEVSRDVLPIHCPMPGTMAGEMEMKTT